MVIKKVPIDQLRLGMHVHAFCGAWIDHPFWRSDFKLRKKPDLDRINQSGILEVLIDTSKGLDVAASADQPKAKPPCPPHAPIDKPSPESQSDDEGSAHATGVIRRSLPKVTALFAAARLGRAVAEQTCKDIADDIAESVIRHPGALMRVARLRRRDEYTYMHSVAVCALMVALGRQLGMTGEALNKAGLAGLLHDIGKMLTPLAVLNKPGKLTAEEFELVKAHPRLGYELLLESGQATPEVLDTCLHHHEKFDGTGYPDGLADKDISLFAKMGAVCDVYDAVTSRRAYKDGWDPGDALRQMSKWSGHFDPSVFRAFVQALGIYPVGSLVRLRSGLLAVVMAQNEHALTCPRVRVFYSTNASMRVPPSSVDLAGKYCRDSIVGCEDPARWKFGDLELLAAAG
jgi:putative nucleotidyltransferase with HDIG domain